MTRPEKTTFFAGILNVIPSSRDLGALLVSQTINGCIVVRDPLLKTRSPSSGIPVKITTTNSTSSIDVPINLYKTYNGDTWLGSVFVTTNTPTDTSIKIALYITDYSGNILQTDENLINITNQWQKNTFSITNTSLDPVPIGLVDETNPNQVRIKVFGPSASGVQIWLDDLRLDRQETVLSIFKSSTTLDGDGPLRDPYSNYDNIYFDSRFDYLNIPGNISYNQISVSLPYRPNRRVRKRKKPGSTKKKRWVDVPISGYKKTLILTHNLGKIPIVIAYEPGGAYFGGSTIYQSAGVGSFRTLWVSADASNLYLNERWYTVFQPLQATSVSLVAYLFNEPASVVTGGPTPPVYRASEPLVISTSAGDLATSLDGQTDTWKIRLEGNTIEEGFAVYYLYRIISLFYLNNIYYAYHLDPDTYLTKDGVDYDTDSWSGWSSDNKALGWQDIDSTISVPIQNAVMIPGSTTNAIGISLSHNYPKRVEIFYDASNPDNDDPPSIGYGWTKPIPYKMYTSDNKGESWTLRGTLPSPTGYNYGSGGAAVACSPSGVVVAVGTMIGGEQIEKVNIIGNWEKFDNENFNPKTVTVTFSTPELAGGITATGEPIIDKFQKLVGVSMTNRGSGYIYTPTVTITDSDQTPATGTVTVTVANTRTDPVVYLYDEYGYLVYDEYGDPIVVTPERKYWTVASATASGTNWLHKRTASISFSNNASANLTISNGVVTAITITNIGNEVGPSATAPVITASITDTDNGTEILGTAVPVLTNGRNKKPSAAYSTDYGLNWIAGTIPSIEYGGLCDVVYASLGGFVAVGNNNLILKSSTGITWIDVSPSNYTKSVHWQSVIYAKTSYFCCGFDNGSSYIIRSYDGVNWTQVFTITGTYIRDLAEYIVDGKLFAVGGEGDPSSPYFSGPSVVYPGQDCWLVITGGRPGESINVTGSDNASGTSYSLTFNSKGEASLGNIAGSFSLGTNGATTTYTYSFTPSRSFAATVSHTVRFVEQVSNSIYSSPNSNATDYTNTTGYFTELTDNSYTFNSSNRGSNVGRTFISDVSGNSWSNIVNGVTKDIHHIIPSIDYIPT